MAARAVTYQGMDYKIDRLAQVHPPRLRLATFGCGKSYGDALKLSTMSYSLI